MTTSLKLSMTSTFSKIEHAPVELRMAGKMLSVEPLVDPTAKLTETTLGGRIPPDLAAEHGLSI